MTLDTTVSNRDAPSVQGHADAATYEMDFALHPKRIRVEFGGEVIADSARTMVLRETRHLPVFYFPRADIRMERLKATDHITHCPFKGNANYWSIDAGGRLAENAAWSYETPLASTIQVKDCIAFYQDRVDAWFEDDVRIFEREEDESSSRENPFIDWLLREAWEAASSRELTRRFVQCLRQGGVPVKRIRIIIRTLHPLLAASNYSWSEGDSEVGRFDISHDIVQSEMFQDSPLRRIFDGLGGIRRWIGAEEDDDFPVLADLRAEGMKDYVAMPMIFSDGQTNAITMATDDPAGFSAANLGFIHEVLPVLSRFYEVHAKRRNAVALMQTFLGRRTGEKVLDGQVKRGDGEDIHAVIWFCDLRNSTPIADRMERDAFLRYLNQFFDCMAGAVSDHGGEVLRFVGDAVLAIFPIDGEDGAAAAAAAVDAAVQASDRINVLNGSANAGKCEPIGFGIGLHVGSVTYGNIGIPERLEFTVIGAAANEAARIESLTKELGVQVTMSKAFTDLYEGDVKSLGICELRGVGRTTEVFTLCD